MTKQSASRARGVLLITLAVGGLAALSDSASAYWLETQLAGVRLGDSAFVLYGNPFYGEPEAIVIATSGAGAGPATSEGFPGESLGGASSGEGAVRGGAGGPGFPAGGPEGPFGGPMGGPSGGSMPMMGGSMGGPMGSPMMGPMNMMGYVPGQEGSEFVLNPNDPGMASGFWGTSRPGTLNVQTGAPMMGGSRPPGAGGGTGPGGALAGPPMVPSEGGFGAMGAGPGLPGGGAGGFMGFQAGGAGAGAMGPGAGAGVGAIPGAGGGSVSGFPVWALSVWFDLRQNEMEYFYMVKDVAVGFVINKIDGKIVAISVAGEACDFARTAMWKPHEYIQLGDSFKQVQYRYGWPHEIETFSGSGNPLATPLSGTSVTFGQNTNEYRRDCILWYHEVRGEKQCNIAFTLHDFLVTRIHVWIPEPI